MTPLEKLTVLVHFEAACAQTMCFEQLRVKALTAFVRFVLQNLKAKTSLDALTADAIRLQQSASDNLKRSVQYPCLQSHKLLSVVLARGEGVRWAMTTHVVCHGKQRGMDELGKGHTCCL